MMFIRRKENKNGKAYYYIVKNIKQEGKVKQKVIMYLGNIDHIIEVFNFYKRHNN